MPHALYRLAVHLEEEQNLYFVEGEEKSRLSKNTDLTLTIWFKFNQENARQYLITETHNHFYFNVSKKIWMVVHLVDHKKRELYFLQLLRCSSIRKFTHISKHEIKLK